jgi:hypothetical protein
LEDEKEKVAAEKTRGEPRFDSNTKLPFFKLPIAYAYMICRTCADLKSSPETASSELA